MHWWGITISNESGRFLWPNQSGKQTNQVSVARRPPWFHDHTLVKNLSLLQMKSDNSSPSTFTVTSAWVWPFRMAKWRKEEKGVSASYRRQSVVHMRQYQSLHELSIFKQKCGTKVAVEKRSGYSSPVCQCLIRWYLLIRSMTNTASALGAFY